MDRAPDLRRCEWIGWLRPVIVEAHAAEQIDVWRNQRQRDTRRLLWFNEEYLVVLAERTRQRDGFQYMQLVTAYCTTEESRKEKLRKERDSGGV